MATVVSWRDRERRRTRPTAGRERRGPSVDPPPGPVRIILDTDLSDDVDDAAAVGVMGGVKDQLDVPIDVLAGIISSSNPYSPGALDQLLRWHGWDDVPIGCWKGPTISQGGAYPQVLFNGEWPRDVGLASTVPDARRVYRDALAAAPDASVTIITIGFLTTINALWQTPANWDDDGLPSGADLMAAKVVDIFSMAGRGPGGGDNEREFNLWLWGSESVRSAAFDFINGYPGRITFLGWTMGDVNFGRNHETNHAGHILSAALTAFGAGVTNDGTACYDGMTILNAFLDPDGSGGLYQVEAGTMTMTSDWWDIWTPGDGPHRNIAARIEPTQFYVDLLEQLAWNPQHSAPQPSPTTPLSAVTYPGRLTSDDDITWTLDGDYPCGQFLHGDWFVVAPDGVQVTATDPETTPSTGWNGSQVNPGDTSLIGYVGFSGTYDQTLNAGANLPVTLMPGDSLVTVRSRTNDNLPASSVRAAGILTCVAEPPPVDSLRPPFSGTYPPKWHRGNVDFVGRLPNLPYPGDPGDLHTFASMYAVNHRTWLDHQGDWTSHENLRPSSHHTDTYGVYMAYWVGTSMLRLCTDTLDDEEKFQLGMGLAQLALDHWGITQVSPRPWDKLWHSGGGQVIGRRFLCHYAAWLLDDPELRDLRDYLWADVGQTFFADGLYRWRWSHEVAETPIPSGALGNGSYIQQSSATFAGLTLALRILGITAEWGHDASFGYQDRFYALKGSDPNAFVHQPFQRVMYDEYVDDYPWQEEQP